MDLMSLEAKLYSAGILLVLGVTLNMFVPKIIEATYMSHNSHVQTVAVR